MRSPHSPIAARDLPALAFLQWTVDADTEGVEAVEGVGGLDHPVGLEPTAGGDDVVAGTGDGGEALPVAGEPAFEADFRTP